MGIVQPTTLAADDIGVNQLLCTDVARRLVEGYVEHYNNVRLSSATGYLTPKNVLASVTRRSTWNATASWKPPDSNARVTAG